MPSLSLQPTPGRRSVLRATAWTIPAITATAATPAFAASGTQAFSFTTHQPHTWSTYELIYRGVLWAPGRTTTLEDVTLTFTFSGDLAGTSTHAGVTGLLGITGYEGVLTTTTTRNAGPASNQTVVTVLYPRPADPRWGQMESFQFTLDKPANEPFLGTMVVFASAHDGSSEPVTYTVDK